MSGKRIAALIGGFLILLSVVGNVLGEDPAVVRGLLLSLAGALVGLAAGFYIRRRTGRKSVLIPFSGAILGAIAANWIGVLVGFQYPNADVAQDLARVTGRGFGEGFLYGGGIYLITYGLMGPYKARVTAQEQSCAT